jgi:pimeloyl-ACP methyl ester carboxylesterase
VIPSKIRSRLSAADQQALQDRELRDTLIASSMEAFRHGVRAAAADGLIYARPWQFGLEQIKVAVNLWHGESDVVVPPSMGRFLASRIPNCRARFYPEEGHFSLPFGRAKEILGMVKVRE